MLRFTGVDPEQRYGLPHRDIAYQGISKEQLNGHRRCVKAHQPFRDFQFAYTLPNADIWWVSVAGESLFDAGATFEGYRVVGGNIYGK